MKLKIRTVLAQGIEKVCSHALVSALTTSSFLSFIATQISGCKVKAEELIVQHCSLTFWILSVFAFICIYCCLSKLDRYFQKRKNCFERISGDTTVLFNSQTGEFICPSCFAKDNRPNAMSVKYNGGITLFHCAHATNHDQTSQGKIFAIATGDGWVVKNGKYKANELLFSLSQLFPQWDIFRPHSIKNELKGKVANGIPLDDAEKRTFEIAKAAIKQKVKQEF